MQVVGKKLAISSQVIHFEHKFLIIENIKRKTFSDQFFGNSYCKN